MCYKCIERITALVHPELKAMEAEAEALRLQDWLLSLEANNALDLVHARLTRLAIANYYAIADHLRASIRN